MISPILEARAEIQKYFRSFRGAIKAILLLQFPNLGILFQKLFLDTARKKSLGDREKIQS